MRSSKSAGAPSMSADPHPITRWLRDTVNTLCPGQVVAVHAVQGARTLVVELAPEPAAAGALIGRDGATINALRHLASQLAARERLEVHVKVVTGNGYGTDR